MKITSRQSRDVRNMAMVRKGSKFFADASRRKPVKGKPGGLLCGHPRKAHQRPPIADVEAIQKKPGQAQEAPDGGGHPGDAPGAGPEDPGPNNTLGQLCN